MAALQTNIQVFGDRDGWLALVSALGDGGEAEVFSARLIREGLLPARPLVVALYKPDKLPAHLEFLVDSVARATEGLRGVVPLRGFVRAQPHGEAVGYAMDLVGGTLLYEARFRSTGARVRFALGLAGVFEALLARGLVWSDAKPDNVFVGPGGRPVLIDLLSLSLTAPLVWPDGTVAPRHFAMATEEWAPPEVCGLAAEDVRHDEHTAAWGLAMNVHQALKGHHPAATTTLDGRPLDLLTQIRAGSFGRFGPQLYSQLPADGGIAYARLPAEIRYLFDLAFRCGRSAPEQRPTPGM